VTTEQRQHCEVVSLLGRVLKYKAKFFRRFITIDKKWVQQFTPGAKAQSKQWNKREKLRLLKPLLS